MYPFVTGAIMLALACCGMMNPAFAGDNALTPAEQAAGWELLFDGHDMAAWRNWGADDLHEKWAVRDGAMTLTGGGGGDVMTRETYAHFDLRLEWRISEGGNSGIFILVDEAGNKIYSHAPEIQILDNERHSDNKLASHLSGSLYDMIASPPSSHKAAGEWNSVRVRFEARHLQVWQNGVVSADITLGGARWNDLLAASKFKDWDGFGTNAAGHIGFQDHGDTVAFRNIRILPLDGSGE